MVATGFFCFGQSGTDSAYTGTVDSVKAKVVVPREPNGPTKAGLAKAIEDGTIYNSTSPYHNVSHEFTYLVVMRDYCDKTLSQMRDNGDSDSYRNHHDIYRLRIIHFQLSIIFPATPWLLSLYRLLWP